MSRPIIQFDNGTWAYADGEGFTKHGQHYMGCGACGYVNFHLIDKSIADLARKRYHKKLDFSWKDPRKMTPQELVDDYNNHH